MVNVLLKVRNFIKRRKPTFRRQQINQYAKFKNFDGWRRPKGYQSKMRLRHRGHRAMPTVGWKSPRAVRGLNRAGFKEVVVSRVADLAKVNAKEEVVVIARTVGGRKTLDILAEAKKMKLNVSNVKDIDARIAKLTKAPKKEKKAKATKAVDKKESKSETKKEAKSEKKSEEAKK